MRRFGTKFLKTDASKHVSDMIKNTEKEAAKRIKSRHNGVLQYVSGYINKDSKVTVRCLKCGELFERTYHHLTTAPNTPCPTCKERERKEREELKKAQREKRKRLADERRKEKQERSEAWKNRPFHECLVCGTLTQNPKYCGEACRRRANNSEKEHRRRAVIKTQMVDKDITVEGLYNRDKGICKLCGGVCDWNDFTVKGDNKIAGDWYPSIDHVVPLAHGGLHSWDNVQLAHRRCNYLKRDSVEDSSNLPHKILLSTQA